MDYLVGLDALSIGELLPLAARGPHEEQVPTRLVHELTNLRSLNVIKRLGVTISM